MSHRLTAGRDFCAVRAVGPSPENKPAGFPCGIGRRASSSRSPCFWSLPAINSIQPADHRHVVAANFGALVDGPLGEQTAPPYHVGLIPAVTLSSSRPSEWSPAWRRFQLPAADPLDTRPLDASSKALLSPICLAGRLHMTPAGSPPRRPVLGASATAPPSGMDAKSQDSDFCAFS